MRIRIAALVGVVLLVAAIGATIYLFRGVSEETPDYGTIYYRYRWGRPHEVRVDINRDGIIEYRAIVPGVIGSDVVPLETWQDPDSRGSFRYHVLFKGGEPSVVEEDSDGDGTFETRMTGDEARTFVARTLSHTNAHAPTPERGD
jgi:hypothetical protein